MRNPLIARKQRIFVNALWPYLSVCSCWCSNGRSDCILSRDVCKWKTAFLAWFSVLHEKFEVFIIWWEGNEKTYLGVYVRFCQVFFYKKSKLENVRNNVYRLHSLCNSLPLSIKTIRIEHTIYKMYSWNSSVALD